MWRDKARKATFQCWQDMKQRCFNPRCSQFKNYGARGITVCDRWRESFDNFVSDMGIRPDDKSIDRIDVNGHYEPSNCRWATYSEQQNNRRDCRVVEIGGRSMTLAEWSREIGIHPDALKWRIKSGWPQELLTSASDQSTRWKTRAARKDAP